MRCRILIALICALAFALPESTALQAAGGHADAVSSWLTGWPMAGHDPQRTNRSPDIGPVHPHVLFTHRGFYARLVGPDGTIYGGAPPTPGITALDPSGDARWTIHECCTEYSAALEPDGTLFVAGALVPDPAESGNGTAALAIRPDGSIAWRIDPFGLPKGAEPLVSAGDLLYAPIVGPENGSGSERYIGLDVLSPQGQVLHHVGQRFDVPALGDDGTVYDGNPLRAVAADGRIIWRHNLGVSVGPLVGKGGVIYAGGQTLASYASSGRLRWKLRWPDDVLGLAQRADGVMLVAGRTRLAAVSPAGKRLWSVRIGRAVGADENLPLVVDAAGTVYVGTLDGHVRIVSRSGKVISTLRVGPGSTQAMPRVPIVMLGPGGRLIVTGTDGVLRVYGS